MKRALFTLALVLIVALGGYWICFRYATASTQAMLSVPNGSMEWLRQEYHLSDSEFAHVQQIHQAYAPKCDLMCGKIAAANERLEQVIAGSKEYSPAVDAAMAECLAVQAECRRAMLRHVYEVSAAMPAAEGSRYLKMMTARIIEPELQRDTVISQSSK